MQWCLLELLLVVLSVYSQLEMVRHTYAKQKDSLTGSFFSYYNSFSVFDYIAITRAEKGSIGGWFWAFVCSLLLLVIVAANDLSVIPEYAAVQIDHDLFWPVL